MENILGKITSQLKSYFGGNTRTPGEKTGGLSEFFKRFSAENNGFQVKDPATQPESYPTPSPSPSPSQSPQPTDLQTQIESGLSRFGERAGQVPPIATQSAQLAQAGSQLPDTISPFFPTILSLMESRGLLDEAPAQNSNPYNIMAPDLVNYQDPSQAILGGGGKLGLSGLLREGGLYQDFRDTGDLNTFFNRYTPPSDPLNPSNQELVDRYNTLLELFVQ